MAKVTRATQLIFGSSAPSAAMAKYGSFAGGVPATYSGSTISPALVQSLSNYLSGWTSAVIGNNAPTIEDMNALCYLFAYQLAYVMQTGIPEWDSATTYFIGSVVSSGAGVYTSTTDNNLNNAVTDGANWGAPFFRGLYTLTQTSGTMGVASPQTLFIPNLVVNTGDTLTVDSGAGLMSVNTITVNGTLTINGTSQVIV